MPEKRKYNAITIVTIILQLLLTLGFPAFLMYMLFYTHWIIATLCLYVVVFTLMYIIFRMHNKKNG